MAAVSRQGRCATQEYRFAFKNMYRWCHIQSAHPDADDTGVALITCSDVHDHVIARQLLSENVRMLLEMLDVSVDCIKISAPMAHSRT